MTCTCARNRPCHEAERLRHVRDRALTEYALHDSDDNREVFYEADRALVVHRRAVYEKEGLL